MDIQTCLEYLVEYWRPGRRQGPRGSRRSTSPTWTKSRRPSPSSARSGSGLTSRTTTRMSSTSGMPWTWSTGDAIDGGHSVFAGGYGPPGAGPLGGDEQFVTWAEETSFTDGFWDSGVEEGWVVIWPEHLGTRGVPRGHDLAELRRRLPGHHWVGPSLCPYLPRASLQHLPRSLRHHPLPAPAPTPPAPSS